MATHLSILAQRIAWTEEPGVLYSPQGCRESDPTDTAQQSVAHIANLNQEGQEIMHIFFPESGLGSLCLVVLSCSVMSDSLPPGVSYHALLQEIFPTRGSNPGLPHCRQILYRLTHREAQEYWTGQPIPYSGDLPEPEIKPVSPASQADSLLTEL